MDFVFGSIALIGFLLSGIRMLILVVAIAVSLTTFFDSPRSTRVCEIDQEARLAKTEGKPSRADVVSMIERDDRDLSYRNLSGAELQYLDLTKFDLTGADLSGASLVGSTLANAELQCAILTGANLSRADLTDANIRETSMQRADLSYADLRSADLSYSELERTVIKGTRLTDVVLASAVFETLASPSSDYVSGIKGIDTVTFPDGRQPGLVNLRQLFRESNLRDLERKATYSIEKRIAYYDRLSSSLERRVDGTIRLVLFQWTAGWGKNPLRPLLIILLLGLAAAPLYSAAIAAPKPKLAIYRVWPSERLAPGLRKGIREGTRAELLSKQSIAAVGWALYFSLLSTFHIGWRDLNLGAWITRVQHREFLLRGYGWVRTISGVQSFLCVYLVAVAVLTYFGRPFG